MMNDPAKQAIEEAERFSRYARSCLNADPLLRLWLLGDGLQPWGADGMRAFLAAQPISSEADLWKRLRELRKRIMLRVLVRDLAGLATLDEVMTTMTALADLGIAFATDHLSLWAAERYGRPIGNDSHSPQSLVVIAMGKLGGRELNVSSDVDLIFAYPEDGQTQGPEVISNHEYFVRLGRALIRALNEPTADGFVFRVDMRLRPYGDSGPLVASFAMLEDYLITQGRAWERYAWVKARMTYPLPRPDAGDIGSSLSKIVSPFVFRRYLDFGAIAELRALHGQIRQEVLRRDLKSNIKLGPGGIREVEFIVQVFQLIRGGRSRRLRIRATRGALAALGDSARLAPSAVSDLDQAYTFLRRLEHRLQYLDDAQTQNLPLDPADALKIAQSLGFDDCEGFLSELARHRALVSRHFEDIFGPPAPLDPGLPPIWISQIDPKEAHSRLSAAGFAQPEAAWDKLVAFRQSSRYRQLPAGSRDRLDRLMPLVITRAGQAPNSGETLSRMLALLESIARRETYLALLAEYPAALADVARLCGASAWAAEYLARHPILLDELLDTRLSAAELEKPQLREALARAMSEAEADVDPRMDALRHFKHAQTFHLLVQDLAGRLPLEILSDRLSDLAEVIVEWVLQECWAVQPGRHLPSPAFAVIGYGKLGGRELGYASDLDIIFLYDDPDPEAPERYARLAQRITHWLTCFTAAGILYEIDLRLRPNGAAGLLVSSLDAFEAYQSTQAWVWEHQALTRARFIAGDPSIGQRFEQLRTGILRAPRDPAALKKELTAMRAKVLTAHPNKSGQFDVKHDRGGMIDIEFCVQYLVLAHAHAHPELGANSGNLALIATASALGLIEPSLAQAARRAYRDYRRLQHAQRLQGEPVARVDPKAVARHRETVERLWTFIFGAAA
ncbi:MAG: bifunctional [glutamate--ammonia ligase]-adenylyl-L-tyrosine phosphorylase/[glutamate--ammonia-ligase] adenylyltransferase [Betaproteobacteria bacterium]|nr:bifunctional [glutamate--ammonia ligase]-adenylyl-L-tyrosine phosphorylase/[glutamate--ammonia-ligase] adenylyltransferase [Betaproteobacteria bacterium]